MVTIARETEREFDAAEHDVLPSIDGMSEVGGRLGPQEEVLEAVYYDTGDLRMAAAGVTLRWRSGGADAGWHLKLPRGGSRDELRVPLGRATQDRSGISPPAELVALSSGYARCGTLQPIAQMTTQRRRWRLTGHRDESLAEVVDDRVVASTLGAHPTRKCWREVEVELLGDGEPELLDRLERRLAKAGVHRSGSLSTLARLLGDRLPARPAPPVPDRQSAAGAAVLAYLAAQAEEIIRCDSLVRQQAPDSVHRMRVAARRMRSTLQVFGKVIQPDRAHRLVAELTWLGDALGAARDLEVVRERLEAATAALPTEEVAGPVMQRFTRYFARREATTADGVRAALADPRYFALLNGIDAVLMHPPLTRRGRRPARRELPRLIRRVDQKMTRRMRRADRQRPGPARDAALHEVRKAAKRLRYATEAARPVIGKPARRFGKRVKTVQQLLGAHHDAVVSGPVLREIGIQAHLEGDNGYTYGLLHGQQRTEIHDVERSLPAAWCRLAARKPRRWLR